MVTLAPFEIDVLSRLTTRILSEGVLARAVRDGEFVGCEQTGVGYFLTFRHPDLPGERHVCSQPTIVGEWNGIISGFVAFLDNHELTLECHSWGDDSIPGDYRTMPVHIRAV